MKKEIIGILICTLLISVAVAPSTAVISNIEDMANNELVSDPVTIGGTIYVDDSNTEGPWDGTIEHPYQHIQDGIDAALIFWTVYVFNGTYYENVTVNKRINLVGEDKNTTIIDGGGIVIKNGGVQITGFTIKNNIGKDGIRVEGGMSNIIIKNNIISNKRYGIYLKRIPDGGPGSNIQITKNIIINNRYDGIFIGGSCTEFGNEISYFRRNKITYNYIANNRYGIHMPCWAERNLIELNEIRDNKEGILFGWEDTGCFPGSWWNIVIKNNFINNEENAYFYQYSNFWHRNYWDDWDGKGRYTIHGVCCYGEHTKDFDWHPAREPYNISIEEVGVGKQDSQQTSQQSLKEQTEIFSLQDLPQLQVSKSKQIINNNGKLNTPQPEEWSPDIVNFAFGLINNLQYPCPFWYFNCVNVICRIWDYKEECYHWYHYTKGEKLYIHRDYYLGILLDHFVFAIFA